MPSRITMPLYMRIGGGAEVHVGDFELPVDREDGTLTLRRTELAAALHSAADAIADPSADEAEEIGRSGP